MKSFKNSYVRNNNLVELQNTSFESPLITTNSYLYYNSFTQIQKDNFKWTAGGNWIDPQGSVTVSSISVWGFSNPFPSCNQCIGLQSNSFIQQSMYLVSSQHTISLYDHTRSGETGNPISKYINNALIGTISSIAVSSWTFFSQTFTIPIAGTVILKLEGTLSTTTGIDNIIVA